jgi:Gly-Xaa carboxypeptidase
MGSRSTDTAFYWKLTRHILRYNHQEGEHGIHTVNECMAQFSFSFRPRILIRSTDIIADNFVEMIRFFTTLILNVDESRKM